MFCSVTITFVSPNVSVTASQQVPKKRKDGVLGVSKLFQINLAFLDVRLVITSVHKAHRRNKIVVLLKLLRLVLFPWTVGVRDLFQER